MSAWVLAVVAVLFAVLLALGLKQHGRRVRLPGSGHEMWAVLDRLRLEGRDRLRRQLAIDDTMIVPGHTGLLMSMSALSVVWIRGASSGSLEAVGVVLSVLAGVLALAAGVLDLRENRAVRTVLDLWQPIPVPTAPDEDEAAARQELRRQQAARIDPATRTCEPGVGLEVPPHRPRRRVDADRERHRRHRRPPALTRSLPESEVSTAARWRSLLDHLTSRRDVGGRAARAPGRGRESRPPVTSVGGLDSRSLLDHLTSRRDVGGRAARAPGRGRVSRPPVTVGRRSRQPLAARPPHESGGELVAHHASAEGG